MRRRQDEWGEDVHEEERKFLKGLWHEIFEVGVFSSIKRRHS